MLIDSVANRILHFDERRDFDRFFRKHSREGQLGQDLALLRILDSPIHVGVPHVPQSGSNALLMGKTGHHRICEFQLNSCINVRNGTTFQATRLSFGFEQTQALQAFGGRYNGFFVCPRSPAKDALGLLIRSAFGFS
jgi:hypothetical protein